MILATQRELLTLAFYLGRECPLGVIALILKEVLFMTATCSRGAKGDAAGFLKGGEILKTLARVKFSVLSVTDQLGL